MVYQAFDDRPGSCEGCKCPDFPSQWGPSTRQISWNSVLTLWLCADCRYQWSEWFSKDYPDDDIRERYKPGFLKKLEAEVGSERGS